MKLPGISLQKNKYTNVMVPKLDMCTSFRLESRMRLRDKKEKQ